MHVVEGLTYQDALKLIEQLGEIGIDARITAGGVSMSIGDDNVERVREICKGISEKAYFHRGDTLHHDIVKFGTLNK